MLIIKNLDLIKRIQVQDFSNFQNRGQAALMNQCCREFMEDLESLHPQDEAVDVLAVFQQFSLDVMLRSTFGGGSGIAIGRDDAGPEIIKRELKKFLASLGSGWQRFVIGETDSLGGVGSLGTLNVVAMGSGLHGGETTLGRASVEASRHEKSYRRQYEAH
ncbi:hypothetical protein HPB47_004342 [Ixodes persulcatus]|uniref:Uncharacterized protein n=1 Tax=Ixodes persulcatus TaxID=34615 RepID=A0AC60PFZ6_IXOPE|nr:hypothetical protein HPB47_004342 [Ixodes persulcatus]